MGYDDGVGQDTMGQDGAERKKRKNKTKKKKTGPPVHLSVIFRHDGLGLDTTGTGQNTIGGRTRYNRVRRGKTGARRGQNKTKTCIN